LILILTTIKEEAFYVIITYQASQAVPRIMGKEASPMPPYWALCQDEALASSYISTSPMVAL